MTESSGRHLRAATLIWMASVAASRVAGLVREMVIARAAGATGQTDVYFTAFTLPDFLNYLLAGGALSITFIPVFLGLMVREDDEKAWRLFHTVMALTLGTLAFLLTAAFVFAAPLCRLFAHGFNDAQQAMLVRYTRILLPAQLFFFAGGLLGAIQMARGRHGVYALSPIVYNGGIIVGGLLLAPRLGMEGFCWGALAGAVAGHGLLQAWGAGRAGLRWAAPDLRHPALRTYLLLTLPFMIGQSILMTDDWLVRYFGSGFTKSISWLNYAKRLALVLPAIVGQASAVASFPLLSRRFEAGEHREMALTLRQSLARTLLAALLGTALLLVLSRDVVFLAYGSGRFTGTDASTTARALAVLALAVPALVAQAGLARGFYAMRDTWRPTVIGTVITLLGIPLYGLLARWFDDPAANRGGGYLGLAWASTISLTAYSLVLQSTLESRLRRLGPDLPPLRNPGLAPRAAGLFLTTLVSLAALSRLLLLFLTGLTPVESFLRVAILSGAGTILFVALGRRIGLESELAWLDRFLPRRRT